MRMNPTQSAPEREQLLRIRASLTPSHVTIELGHVMI